MDTSSFSDLLTAALGSMTLSSLVRTLMLVVVCLLVIRAFLAVASRLTVRLAIEERARGYILSAVRIALYLFAVLIVADSIGIPVTSLIALVSVFGLAISLAVQDVLGNVASGLVILFSKPFVLGDYVSTGDGEGTVAEISLTHTKLDTPDGQRVMLPNGTMVSGKIVNFTTLGVRRVNHGINVSYDCAIQDVRAACLRAVSKTKGVLSEPAPAAVVSAYGDNAVEYRVRFWTKNEDYWDAYSQSLEEIRRAFEEDGIAMTYHHLNVHIVEHREK